MYVYLDHGIIGNSELICNNAQLVISIGLKFKFLLETININILIPKILFGLLIH